MGRSQQLHGLLLLKGEVEGQWWSCGSTVVVVINSAYTAAIPDGNTIVIAGSAASVICENNLWSSMLLKHAAVCWLLILTGDFPNQLCTGKQHPGCPISKTSTVPSGHWETCKASSISFLV